MHPEDHNVVFIDGSRLITEALVEAGAHVFIGYPITPANRLYAYANQRFPLFLAAPDEISALQWAAGFSATGTFPVTATSFPGLALMVETLNMAFMMELPMVIVLAQRMGPSTGSATTGAQGDLLLLRGALSGGYTLPVFCPSDFNDCWTLATQSVATALRLRTPVVLLTSKEMIMTNRSFDLAQLRPVRPDAYEVYEGNGHFAPYAASMAEAPPFLPVGHTRHQVRLNASTHDESGLIRKATPEALANTYRLQEKIEQRVAEFGLYDYDAAPAADTLVVTYGVSADAARDAVRLLRSDGIPVSLLVVKTLLPMPPALFTLFEQYERLIFVEENLPGAFREICFGKERDARIRAVNRLGHMITPSQIIQEVTFMPGRLVIKKKMPFCPGCGHTVVTHALAKALDRLEVDPLDVVVVSDIGCCGMVDGVLACHTVHGLHGRSTALALGITLGLDNPDKKVIVIQGDGGATIGLQHLLEAARQNVDMTLIIHNNMVYGMTGGQISGLSSPAFKAERLPESRDIPAFDVCTLAHHAGASLSVRAFVGDTVADLLEEALRTDGFALVEIVEMCPAHGVGKVRDLHAMAGHDAVSWTRSRPPVRIHSRHTPSLLGVVPGIAPRFEAALTHRLAVVIAGSAGEGVQGAGDVLAFAGIASGLQATKKGAFPVTVGSGFSVAEVMLSRDPIHYTGIETPDVMIIVSADGFEAVKHRIGPETLLIMDASLTLPPGKEAVLVDFRKTGGVKGAALAAVAYWLGTHDVIPLAALEEAAGRHKHADKLLATIASASQLTVGAC